MNKSIELNEQEANALLTLINIAVKAAGMEAAETGVILTKKIQNAFKPVEQTVEEATEHVKEDNK